MTEKEFMDEFGKMDERRINYVIYTVNAHIPKEKADLKTEVEFCFYDRLIKQAKELERKCGKWPVFDLCEID